MKIPWAKPTFWGDEERFVIEALRSSWISGGPFVDRLEKDFSHLHGVPYGVTASSGTAALHMALLACGIKTGDEVILPGFGFLAAANMALSMGVRPIFADIDPATWCMDPVCVEKMITKRVKAIVVVHPYGNMCDMPVLRRISRQHGLVLIEDAAQALFSRYRGCLAGTWGDVGCFSFQATKTITTGEGGFALTRRPKIAAALRLYRDHGMLRQKLYRHQVAGHNFRLTNLQAALGLAQLKHVRSVITARCQVARWYRQYLKDIEGVTLQAFEPVVDPVIWCTAVALDPEVFDGKRDRVIKRMAACGIETRPGFYPPSTMPLYKTSGLPVSRDIAARVIALPCGSALTQKQVRYICECLQRSARS